MGFLAAILLRLRHSAMFRVALAAFSLAPSFPDPGKQLMEVDDRLVVLIRTGDSFFCLDDVCTHDGGTLGEGELEEDALCCPRHGAKFDIKTGEALSMPATESNTSLLRTSTLSHMPT